MGTTVTTNLGLIKPDLNESIQQNLPTYPGWAVQNGLNVDKIDSLFRHSSLTWTPTLTADTVNPTLGTGNIVQGKYIRLYPRLVIGYFTLFMGTTGFAPGTGIYYIAPPVAPAAELLTLNDSFPVGRAHIRDDDTVATSTANIVMYSNVNNLLYLRGHAGDLWKSGSPMVLAQQDRIIGYFMYPTSVP